MHNIPLLGIAAYSGTGKTTLLKQLIPHLSQQGVRVGLIKHTHHDVDIDVPGKDSYQLRKAGAAQTLIAGKKRWSLITETPQKKDEVNLQEMAAQFDATLVDLILVEGFKQEAINKISLYRQAIGKPLESLIDQHTLAIASDEDLTNQTSLHTLNLNDVNQITDFIVHWLKQQ